MHNSGALEMKERLCLPYETLLKLKKKHKPVKLNTEFIKEFAPYVLGRMLPS